MDFKPLSGRLFPRYSGIKTFFRLPFVEFGIECESGKISPKKSGRKPGKESGAKLRGEDSDFSVALFGIPFDGGVSYRPGARFAPGHVREASSLGRGFHWSRGQNLFDKLKIADIGDCQTVPIDLQQTYQKIEAFVNRILEHKKKFLAVGGDHSVTLPTLRALKKHYGKPLAFIHFDAHLDTYPAAWGCEFHHGSFARHAVEEGLVNPQKMVQIGLRGPLASGEDLDFATRHKIKLITIDDVRAKDLSGFLKTLPKFDSTPTFVSFDIDCLDPAYAPGTGTPVPGGLTTYEVQRILRALKLPNLVGADLVEICPAYDSSDITALAGVDVMFELLHHLIET